MKALRRPNVAAGAINRAVREHGADDLLAAGEALREAHEALLSGNGDAAAVREATAREREAVRDFARLALGEARRASTEDKVRATLHAASVDDDVRDLLDGRPPRARRRGGSGPDGDARRRGGRQEVSGSGATKAPPSARSPGGPLRQREVGPLRQPKTDRSGAKKSDPPSAERKAAGEGGRAGAEAADRALTAQAEAETARSAPAPRSRRPRRPREGPRGRGGPGGARARGAPRAQGGRGGGRAPPHRGPAGRQGRRVAQLAVAFRRTSGARSRRKCRSARRSARGSPAGRRRPSAGSAEPAAPVWSRPRPPPEPLDQHPHDQAGTDAAQEDRRSRRTGGTGPGVGGDELHRQEVEEAAPEARPAELRERREAARMCSTGTSPTRKPGQFASTGM